MVTVNGKFASLQECMVKLPGVPQLNLASTYKHESHIKHHIHVVKEIAQAIQHSLPFSNFPKQLTIYMIFYAMKLLNDFPVKGGLSNQNKPKAILVREFFHYNYYSKPFGTYCQIHEDELLLRHKVPYCLGQVGMHRVGTSF